MARVELRGVSKRYGKVSAVENVDLEIADGEFVVLLGPSGCGKSTTLRMVAGLEDITSGSLSIGNRVVNRVDPKDRGVAMVFQNYALYPHKTVAENMGMALKMRGMPREEIARRVADVAEMLGLTALLERRPAALSGGQRQRVAIGRAIVRTPEVFLFDEPLSNLDAKLRVRTRMELQRLHERLGVTSIYVTHDQVEAMTLADRIVVMNEGRIAQIGTPREVYERPEDLFVAGFVGSPAMNLVPMKRAGEHGWRAQEGDLTVDGLGRKTGDLMVLGVRPEHIAIGLDEEAARPNPDMQGLWRFEATVTLTELLGADALVTLDAAGVELIARVEESRIPARGRRVLCSVARSSIHSFDQSTGRRLA